MQQLINIISPAAYLPPVFHAESQLQRKRNKKSVFLMRRVISLLNEMSFYVSAGMIVYFKPVHSALPERLQAKKC